jgi:hypothetical protein
MEAFILLFQNYFTPKDAQDFIQDHEHCDTCEKAILCPIKNWSAETVQKNLFFVEQFASNYYPEIMTKIAEIIDNPRIKLIILLDAKGKCYIYKAEGNITHIEQEILPDFIEAVTEATGDELYFSSLSDVRSGATAFRQYNAQGN